MKIRYGRGEALQAARPIAGVTIGRQYTQRLKVAELNASSLGRVAEAISNDLFSTMALKALNNRDDTIRAVAREMEDAADQELLKVFDVMASAIDGTNSNAPQLTVQALSQGMQYAQGFRKRMPFQSISWRPLTPAWEYRKVRRRSLGIGHMFKNTGLLQRYLGGNSEALAIKKLGLSQVSVLPQDKDLPLGDPKNVAIRRLGLARIELRLMPKVSPFLLPLIRSGNWRDGGRRLDFRLFQGGARFKLAGPSHEAHRPFTAPALQFFLMYRIPSAIRAPINDKVRSK